jgi:hypothetical protein
MEKVCGDLSGRCDIEFLPLREESWIGDPGELTRTETCQFQTGWTFGLNHDSVKR